MVNAVVSEPLAMMVMRCGMAVARFGKAKSHEQRYDAEI